MDLRLPAAALLAAILLALPGPLRAQTDPVPGRVVLRLDETAAARLRAGALDLPAIPGAESVAARVTPLFPGERGRLGRFAVVTFDPAAALGAVDPNEAWLEAYRAVDGVETATSDVLLHAAALPDDPGLLGYWAEAPAPSESTYVRQKHLVNPGGAWSLEATRAWPFVPSDAGAVVAVLDSGVDWMHPDLGGAVMGDGLLWRNEAEFAGMPGVDDDGNGFVDDFIGWDFVDGASPCGGAEDCNDEDNDPMDFQGHGTFVAGTVTARTDNATGIAGHDGALRIMAVRMAWGTSTASTTGTLLAKAILYAGQNGADVINVSYDTATCPVWIEPNCAEVDSTADRWGVAAAIDEAIQVHGAVVVGSAGNQNTSNPGGFNPQYLAMRDDCLGVAAVDSTATKTGASNYGAWVDVAAFGPGNQGYGSLWYQGTEGLHRYRAHPNGGTSFAAPMVSSLAGLLRAVDPDATSAEVRGLITATRRDIGNANLGGLADHAAAVRMLSGGWDATGSAAALVPGPDGEIAHRDGGLLVLRGVEDGAIRVGTAAGTAGFLDPAASGTGGWGILQIEDDLIALRNGEGALVPGWPIDVGTQLGSLHLVDLDDDPSPEPEAVIATADSVLVREHDGTPRFSVPFSPGALVIGAFESGTAGRQIAVVNVSGAVRVYDRTGALLPAWTQDWNAGGAVVSAAGLTFRSGEEPYLAFLSEDLKDDSSELHVVRRDTARFPKVFFTPRGRSLAVLGDTDAGEAYLLVDVNSGSTDTLYRVDGDGAQVARPLAGIVAGEPLVADIDGDWNHEVVVVRADGAVDAFDPALQPEPGFPRRLPGSVYALAGAALVDDATRRRLVLADEAGTLWSIPFGPAGRPATWVCPRGGSERTGFVSFGRATPLAASAVLTAAPGSVCWEGTGFDAVQDLRLRVRPDAPAESVFPVAVTASGCLAVPGSPGDRVVLEGRDRVGGWERLGETRLVGAPAPVLTASPNPFRDGTVLRFAPLAVTGVMEVHDVRGRRLARVDLPPGTDRYAWDGSADGGRSAAAGIYFVRLVTGEAVRTLRIVRLP